MSNLIKGVSFVLAIDEGTTNVKAVLFDKQGKPTAISRREVRQILPSPGWVEQDPEEIWTAVLEAVRDVLQIAKTDPSSIAAIGITNQRETTILWDVRSGKPVYNAIVWQDRRTWKFTDWLKASYGDLIRARTGLVPDPYFSASKVKWIMDNIPGVLEKAKKGEVKFGTVDSFLIWRLTEGRLHLTDYSNASRTMMFNIAKLEWDEEVLDLIKLPQDVLPEVKPSSEVYGQASIFGVEVPISGDAGDQQAALFGQTGFTKGDVKCTYGTGTFLLMNTGEDLIKTEDLLTTVAWGLRRGSVSYALEGSVFASGSALRWFIERLGLFSSESELEELAKSVPNTEGTYFVPALTGLGTPYWDPTARGLIIGLTTSTTKAHVARAALESIAFQVKDVVEAMKRGSGSEVKEVKVDGGLVASEFLMKFQADILDAVVEVPEVTETTSRGAAFLAGLATGFYGSTSDLKAMWRVSRIFKPTMTKEERMKSYEGWRKAVSRSLNWERS